MNEKNKKIYLPLNKSEIVKLKIGEKVLLNGNIYIARDMAHKKIIEILEKKEELPFSLKNQTIYYAGPSPCPPNKIIGSIGPTTSKRMDIFTPILLDAGLQGMIGKGERSSDVKKAIKKNKAIYFLAIGGAGVLYAKCVTKAELIAYPEFGPEAIYKLTIKDFPVFVAIDTKGNSIFQT